VTGKTRHVLTSAAAQWSYWSVLTGQPTALLLRRCAPVSFRVNAAAETLIFTIGHLEMIWKLLGAWNKACSHSLDFSSNAAVTSQHRGIQAGGICSLSARHQAGQPECLEFCLADRGSMYAPLRDPCRAFWEIMAECSEGSGGGWATVLATQSVLPCAERPPGFLIPSPRPATCIGACLRFNLHGNR